MCDTRVSYMYQQCVKKKTQKYNGVHLNTTKEKSLNFRYDIFHKSERDKYTYNFESCR